MIGLFRNTEEEYRVVYRTYLQAYQRHKENGGPKPSRDHVDELREELGSCADEISFEVEGELGLPAVLPKRGN